MVAPGSADARRCCDTAHTSATSPSATGTLTDPTSDHDLTSRGSASVRLKRQIRQARCRLFDCELDAEVSDVRQRILVAAGRARRHDLVNAFSAVEGAALIMERETLSDADRAAIAQVLSSGIGRLRCLLLEDPPEGEHVPLAELVGSMAAEPAWRGRVSIEMAAELVVTPPPGETVEVVRQLLTHATRGEPAAPVSLRAHRNGDRVEMWVDSHGPPPPAGGRPGIPKLTGRGPVGALHVAIRLAREQDGDVVVKQRPGGGESFGISWPAYCG